MGHEDMAKHFLGYGHWEAKYWFVGPEQGGGAASGDDNNKRCSVWVGRGKKDLEDVFEYHAALGVVRWWEGEKPPLQPTWRKLIRLLLVVKGEKPEAESIRRYQRHELGRLGKETCLLELSAFAAPSQYSFHEHRSMGEKYRRDRELAISKRVQEHSPALFLMYGARQRDSLKRIMGREVAITQFDNYGFAKIGSTVFAYAPHPVAFGGTNRQWELLGSRLRSCLNDQ